MPLTVGMKQVGIKKGVVRKFLLSGNPLLIMYPFDGVGDCILSVCMGETSQRVIDKQT